MPPNPYVQSVAYDSFDFVKPFQWLRTKQRNTLIALFIFAIGYGVLVEIRGALIRTRHTDAGVYFSAP